MQENKKENLFLIKEIMKGALMLMFLELLLQKIPLIEIMQLN